MENVTMTGCICNSPNLKRLKELKDEMGDKCKVYCETGNSHYTSIKSAAHAAYTGGSRTITLPGTDGAADEFLQTNGSGVTSWSTVPAGAPTGGGTDKVFFENEQTVDTNYTLTSNNNAVSAGPVTVASGVTLTVESGGRLVTS